MPVYHFECEKCLKTIRKMLEIDPKAWAKSCQCGGNFRRKASGPSCQVMERLDNGAMPRAVERLAEVERIQAEDRSKRRSDQDS
jgi:putative FmdB family regulatory protein